MRYIDFDGVILDTDDLLFYEWRKNVLRSNLSELDKIKYIQGSDWRYIINNSPVINDSINILNNIDYNKSAILTMVHSCSEGYEKIIYLRSKGVKQDIILVPYFLKKTDVVLADGNILVDDSLKNLSEWNSNGGYPMFFDKDNNNVDSWGIYNSSCYQRVKRIDEKVR